MSDEILFVCYCDRGKEPHDPNKTVFVYSKLKTAGHVHIPIPADVEDTVAHMQRSVKVS